MDLKDGKIPKVEKVAFLTCLEMLEDRGYTIDRANVGSDEDMHWFIHAKSKIKGRVLVACIFQPSKFTVAAMKKQKVPFEKLILVGQKVAPISRIVLVKEGVEVFSVDELVINPIRLRIAPIYHVLSEEEKTELFRRRSITIDCLPLIHATDKAVKYLGLSSGDIVKTTSKMTGAVSYQAVKYVVRPEHFKRGKLSKADEAAEGEESVLSEILE
ncbi:hypothetical protein QYM36_012097, partial [Artemia franciscana]